MIKIYTINCPITNEIKYVGKTKQKLKTRLSQHINNTKRYNTKLCTWLKSIRNKNEYPIILEIDSAEDNEYANILEILYIGLFRSWNIDLKNHTIGGDGMSQMSQEIKDKISKSRIGRFTGKNNSFYGKKHSEETLKLMRGPKHTKETKNKMSIRMINAYKTGERNINGKKNPRAKAIGKYDLITGALIKKYAYISETKIDGHIRRNIHDVLNGKFKQHHGYGWKYIEE